MEPKVFISHASEDKERFVIEFATKLRQRGIVAWVDKWEMLPGDSLIDKIFEEGIKSAQALIVVVSSYSIVKPWVREELNAAMVKKINSGTKLIPVIIDDCEVPECLHATLWQKINNIKMFDKELERIVMSIYGFSDKPPIGESPTYVKTIIDSFHGLNKVDSIIFKISCEKAIADSNIDTINSSGVFETVETFGIDKVSFYETLEILDRKGFIKAVKLINGDIPCFSITINGLDKYFRQYISNYVEITDKVCYQLVNNRIGNFEIAEKLMIPIVLVDHVFNLLAQRGFIKFNRALGGKIFLYDISPELKRKLDQ